MKENEKINQLKFIVDNNKEINIKDLDGKKIVIYFYPKDDTPGCTREAIDFTEKINEFNNLNTEIYGVSKDSVEKHQKFKKKHDLKIKLVSDVNGITCEQFGVWVEKSMYGKTYMGIQRSTFVIDENFIVKKIWRNVKVKGHVDEVLDYLRISS